MLSRRIEFNISASSLNLFHTSPLQFYYDYIVKEKPDTDVYTAYGDGGTAVHESLEEYENGASKTVVRMKFEEIWKEKNLDNSPIINGFLKKQDYLFALESGMKIIDNKYTVLHPEEEILFPLVDNEKARINIKGIIDLQATEKISNEYVIVDWKTSNRVDEGEDFKRQGLFYTYLTFRKYKKMPKKMIFEYVKIGQTKEYRFTEFEVKEFERKLLDFAEEIQIKGFDIEQYDFGNIEGIFNKHKKKCMNERIRRSGVKIIIAERVNNRLIFKTIPQVIINGLKRTFSYIRPGTSRCTTYAKFTYDKHKNKKRIYDGTVCLFRDKDKSLPYPYFKEVISLIEKYNKSFNDNYVLKIIDRRDQKIVQKKYDTIFKESSKKMYYYQKDAVNKVIDDKIGILSCGCSAGKTFIASNIIRKLQKKTLFLINRVELVRQTKEVFEEELGIEIGEMSEGNLDVDKQITVASIQTIYAILKRNDESKEQLQKYLREVTLCIYDECHNVSSSAIGLYGIVSNEMSNVEYIVGLTGTPFRSAEKYEYKEKFGLPLEKAVHGDDTLEMNSLVGFSIFTKTTAELEAEGFTCPTKCYFLKMRYTYDFNAIAEMSVEDRYTQFIVKNEHRNIICKNIIELHKDKKVIVLVRRIEHGDVLEALIPGSFFLNGSTPSELRKRKFNEFKESKGSVLISMVKIIGAGVNIPDLDMLINMSAHKSDVDTVQIIGRLKRKSPGKTHGIYVDFFDDINLYKGASKQRIEILQHSDYGNVIQRINDIGEIK